MSCIVEIRHGSLLGARAPIGHGSDTDRIRAGGDIQTDYPTLSYGLVQLRTVLGLSPFRLGSNGQEQRFQKTENIFLACNATNLGENLD